MATVNARKGSAGFTSACGGTIFTLYAAIDFSKLKDSTGAAYTPTSTDVLQILDIPAGCRVMHVTAKVDTVMGSAGTLKVGDASDDDGYITSLDLNTTGYTKENGAYLIFTDADVTGNMPVVGGKIYSSAAVLQGTFGGTLAALGIVQFYVTVERLTDQA